MGWFKKVLCVNCKHYIKKHRDYNCEHLCSHPRKCVHIRESKDYVTGEVIKGSISMKQCREINYNGDCFYYEGE